MPPNPLWQMGQDSHSLVTNTVKLERNTSASKAWVAGMEVLERLLIEIHYSEIREIKLDNICVQQRRKCNV